MTTKTKIPTSRRGKKSAFTLIEVIAVLVLLGILVAVALPRYIDMTENARDRAIDAGIAELNGRETMTWGDIMLENAGTADDADVWTAMNTDLGDAYSWDAAGTLNALADATAPATATLWFQEAPEDGVGLTRTAALPGTDPDGPAPAVWARAE